MDQKESGDTLQLVVLLEGKGNAESVESLNLEAIESEPLWRVSSSYLADFQAYQVDITNEKAKQWLKGELIVTALGNSDAQVATYVQTGPVIDALYTQGTNDADEVTDLGAVFTDNEGKAGVSFKL